MSTVVRLVRLSCEETEDDGADEVYMNWNGERMLYTTEMYVGDWVDLEEYRPVSGEAVVDLQESDWPDDDDFLGRIIIKESEADQGERNQAFRRDGAHYTLVYEVRS
jgi:hypothetical protein